VTQPTTLDLGVGTGSRAIDQILEPGALRTGISAVVPVYRSAEILPELCQRLRNVLEQLTPAFEIVLVEDSSPDRSWSVITELAESDPRIRGIRLRRNYGQHNALLCGLRAARYDVTVTLDDDLQNPPEEIEKLLSLLTSDVDVVYGKPIAEAHGLFRNMASRITKIALQEAMGAEVARHVSAFRAFRTSLREAFGGYRGPSVSVDVLLTWGTTRFAHTAVRHMPRQSGESGYTFRKLLTHALTLVTGFSTLPLQIASFVGFVFTAFGFVVLIYVIGAFIIYGGDTVPGFAFLASIVAIFSGAQLFALGIIGEYLARIHFRSMDRPTYVVRQTTVEE